MPLPNILYHIISSKNFGVETRFRLARRFGSFKKRGSHSKANNIQNII